MTGHAVHNEPYKVTTTPFANRLLLLTLVAGSLLVGVLIGATFGAPHAGPAHHASVDSSRGGALPAVEPMKIVPADVLGPGVSWSPRTGDGSN